MAINDIVQTIAEARVDARSLSEFVFKPVGFKVTRRLAPTIDTLQFYVNSLSLAVTEAEGKVAYIESTVQDAINNTAVEGGVLADTFVTMTANTATGLIARNLRQIRSDSIILKDYGAVGDGITDDTGALELAMQVGKPINITAGKYLIKSNGLPVDNKNLVLYSHDDAELLLDVGNNASVFDLVSSNKVEVTGITIRSTNGELRRLFGFSGTPYIKYIGIRNNFIHEGVCTIRGRGEGDVLIDSNIHYGFDEFYFTDNKVYDSHFRNIMVQNIPVYKGVVSNNTIHNFSEVFAYFGNFGSDNMNQGRIVKFNDITVEGNHVTNDDDYFTLNTNTDYYSFILIYGGYSTTFINNKISGMKVNEGSVSLYDAYMTCKNVKSYGNTYKNNANFSLASTHSYLMKAKDPSTPEEPCVKVFKDNTYIIEDAWLAKINLGRVVHRLADVGGPNAGTVTISNNHIYLDMLGGSLKQVSNSFKFINNTIDFASFYSGDAAAKAIVHFASFDDLSYAQIKDNNVNVRSGGRGFSFLRSSPNNPSWHQITLENNSIVSNSALESGSTFLYEVNAKTVVADNNTVLGSPNYSYYGCYFEYPTITNNKYMGISEGFQGDRFSRVAIVKGVISDTYSDVSSTIPIFVPWHENTGLTGEYMNTVVLELLTPSGCSTLSFEYTQKFPTSSTSTITYTNADDVLTDVDVVQTGGARGRIKLEKVSGVDSAVYVELFREKYDNVSWMITNMPNDLISCKITRLIGKSV